MSHELRTPLNAVLGFSRILRDASDATPRQAELLDQITRSGQHLRDLIDDVLDMAKIEAGKVTVSASHFDLRGLVADVEAVLGERARAKGLRFVVQIDEQLPRTVVVDGAKVRQVLVNLVGNAVKFTSAGEVLLRAERAKSADDDRTWLQFEVRDTGPGIAKEDQSRIFETFVQVGAPAASQAGTGLGLAISRQRAEVLGGRLELESEPGEGSTFRFTVPAQEVKGAEPQCSRVVGLAAGQPRWKVLIAEDDGPSRLLMRQLLEPLGFELREAADGLQAVEEALSWHPHLILMDIRMPGIDGTEAARRILADAGSSGTKIIAVTAHALEEERARILSTGFVACLRKPVIVEELFDALAAHVGVVWLREDVRAANLPNEDPSIAPEELASLPDADLRDLTFAAEALDARMCKDVIARIGELNAALARRLGGWVDDMRYQELQECLERANRARNS